MDKKRSVGVTVFAIIFILFGLWRIGPGVLLTYAEAHLLTTESFIIRKAIKDRHSSYPKDKEETLKQVVKTVQEKLNKPIVKFQLNAQPFLVAIIGIVFLVSGFGLLGLKSWSLYALKSVLFLDLFRRISLTWALISALMQSMTTLFGPCPTDEVRLLPTLWLFLSIQMIPFLIVFVIALWFFTRPQVKLQFKKEE